MMKSMGQLLLITVPLLALIAFFIVMKGWGGIAPDVPVSEKTIEAVEVPAVPRTARRQPTLLSPEPVDGPIFPPGMEPFPAQPPVEPVDSLLPEYDDEVEVMISREDG